MSRHLARASRVLCVAVALAWSGCSDPTVPEEPANYTGIVEAVTPSDSPTSRSLAIVWVRPEGDQCGIRFTVNEDTRFYHGGRPATLSQVIPAKPADVWFDGVVAESCPGPATADVSGVR